MSATTTCRRANCVAPPRAGWQTHFSSRWNNAGRWKTMAITGNYRSSPARKKLARDSNAALYYYISHDDGDDMLLACKESDSRICYGYVAEGFVSRANKMSSGKGNFANVSSWIPPGFCQRSSSHWYVSKWFIAYGDCRGFCQCDTWRVSMDREMHRFINISSVSLIGFHERFITYDVLSLLTRDIANLVCDKV